MVMPENKRMGQTFFREQHCPENVPLCDNGFFSLFSNPILVPTCSCKDKGEFA